MHAQPMSTERHTFSNKILQLHSTHVMWLTLVPAHKPHGGMTLRQLQILHKPRGEHQMLALSRWCGKCQWCRWRRVFYFLGVRLRPVPAVRRARHLIHKHGGGAVDVVVCLADCRKDARLLYRPFIIHGRVALCFEATQMWSNSTK